jgi:hypothetical protein
MKIFSASEIPSMKINVVVTPKGIQNPTPCEAERFLHFRDKTTHFIPDARAFYSFLPNDSYSSTGQLQQHVLKKKLNFSSLSHSVNTSSKQFTTYGSTPIEPFRGNDEKEKKTNMDLET